MKSNNNSNNKEDIINLTSSVIMFLTMTKVFCEDLFFLTIKYSIIISILGLVITTLNLLLSNNNQTKNINYFKK